MNYTFHQLKIFQKIVETGSITKAAEQLNLTQPAVSIQLKNLQSQFEIPLTEVIGRQIHITEFGKELAEIAQRILNEAEGLNHITMAHKGHITGKIKIITASTAKYVMPYFIADFMNQHPGLDLDIKVTNQDEVIKSLEENAVDFAMLSILPKNLDIERIQLIPNILHLVGKNPINSNSTIDHEELEKLPLIFREEGSATRQAMDNFFIENKLQVSKRLVLSSNEAVKQSLLAGLGYSIISLNGIKNELKNKDLHIIKTNKLPIINEWNLIWLKNKKFSPAASAYIEYLRKHKNEIIEKEFSWLEQKKGSN